MISENTKAVLLLTSFFHSQEVGQYKVLTINEYGYLACWLKVNGYTPACLLEGTRFVEAFSRWKEPLSHSRAKKMVDFHRLEKTVDSITSERVKELLERGTSLSLALDKWLSAGIWVMDRQNLNYPASFKKQLKHRSPPILFGVGNQDLLNQPAVGFVGSRDCSPQDEHATHHYVQQINALGYQVVSGGAKGVDSCSMLSALNAGYTAVGVLADNLFRASASNDWRQHLKDERLVLISPFYPEVRFTSANAMARNKYIYLLSEATIAVTSAEKGGTWEGAKENLKKQWVPLLVSTHKELLQKGNQALLAGLPKTSEKGIAVSLDFSQEELADLIKEDITPNTQKQVGIPESNGGKQLFNNYELSDIDDTQFYTGTEPQTMFLFDNVQDHGSEVPTVQKSYQETHEESVESLVTEVIEQKTSSDSTSVVIQSDKTAGLNTQDSLLCDTPLLEHFYQQIVELLAQQDKPTISKQQLDESFPEFELIGKSALDKWLNHLTEVGLLTKPNARKKEYRLPSRVD